MQHITDYLKVEDLEIIDIDIIEFYNFVEFKGITIEGEVCFETKQLKDYLGRELSEEEKEKIRDDY